MISNHLEDNKKTAMSQKKKPQKNNMRLPEIKLKVQQEAPQGLTDPPQLRKTNLKPFSNYSSQKPTDPMLKLVDIFEKTQSEFSHIYKQILAINERQDSFNAMMAQNMQADLQRLQGNTQDRREAGHERAVEPRYRFFLLEGWGGKGDPSKVRRWLTKVISQTFSFAFHEFSKRGMTYDQAKIFCASNILRNIIFSSDRADLTAGTLELMEEEMARLLKYLQLKYPLTQSTQINKALQGVVQEVDNSGLLAHNYFATSHIVFEWREGGNYNDLIMKMLNDIFSRIDQKSPLDKGSNYADFKKSMTAIFDSVEEEEMESVLSEPLSDPQNFMIGIMDFVTDRCVRAKSAIPQPQEYPMKDSSKLRQEKERYRNRVKEYTHYAIGRKVPESYQPYSNKEIEATNLAIRSPAVLRILTKWSEELRNKFITPDYYAALSDAIKCQKGQVHSLLFPLRKILDEEMQKEEIEIQKYLKNAAKDNFELQLRLIRKELKRAGRPLQDFELESVCGRYSIQMLNSLHSHLTGYLNRLIHGLVSVSKRFHERSKDQTGWKSPPDLVTFTIGDLLRCKISSKEREILRVYDQLKQISVKSPQRLKIIRVKNRLNKSTNDILVNVKFNNLITAEIQLAVKVQTSDFIKCSNTFCHFLYELQRSPFGAIAELCNVWAALDRTADHFKQLLDAQAARQTPMRAHSCSSPQYTPFQRSFICFTCEVTYYHNNYLRNHMQCLLCHEVVCAKCLLREQNPQDLKALLISNKNLRASCRQLVARLDTSENLVQEEVPEYGVCISIERRAPNVQIFKKVTYRNSRYLFAREGGEIYEVEKIQTAKQTASFLRRYLIFRLDPQKAHKYISLSQEEANEKWILPRALTSAYRREKQTLVIGDNLSHQTLQKSLRFGFSQAKDKIRKMFLDSNSIETVSFIANEFRNVVLLELSYNPIQNLQGLDRLLHLKSLSLSDCQLRGDVPATLYSLRSLEELRLSNNILSDIRDVGKLDKLKLLDLSGNQLRTLPSGLGKCTQLVLLRLQSNMLQTLPKEIEELKDLRQLYLSNNSLLSLPVEIQHLAALEHLEARENQLRQLPQSFGKLFSLQKIDLSANQLQLLPSSFEDLQSLRQLNLSNNVKLLSLPPTFSRLTLLQSIDFSQCGFIQFPNQVLNLLSLRILQMSRNKLQTLPSLQSLHNLQIFQANFNSLSSKNINDQFSKLCKLQTLKLSNNFLTVVPNFFYCQKLKHVDLSYNQIVELTQRDLIGLETLQTLKLDHNRLQKIANGLISLPKLREINLAANYLQKLEADLQAVWPSLLKIDLSQNQLNEVPPCLLNNQMAGSVSHIASIDISSNQIEELPLALTKLRHLRQFRCNKNQLKQVTGQMERFMREEEIDNDLKEMRANDQLVSPYRKQPIRSKDIRRR